jgi:CubicO group peptidase (beta-lactamase class C family)
MMTHPLPGWRYRLRVDGARKLPGVAADGCVLPDRVRIAAVAGLSAGTSRHGARAFADGADRPAAGLAQYRIASLTKPFTAAALVLALVGRGVPLSVPAVELLPSLAADWRADPAITVGQLLGQVSGLRQAVDSPALAVAGIGDGAGAIEEAARLVVLAGSERAPGERWAYYNGNYLLAGALLQAVTGVTYEEGVEQAVIRPWGLGRTGFGTPREPVTGWDDGSPVPAGGYPRARRPSGGLWSCAADLLTFAERLLAAPALLGETRVPRTRPGDRVAYGLGWAIGPSGQLYLNGRLPGYRAAFLLSPAHGYASVALASGTDALPAVAGLLSDLQQPLTGDDLSQEIDAFAA